ncbi:patatin-like phospholipase family protein [Humitalea sp. 24SJ18S-53]|uniref:patatin-like phospholipase family protein n=1 Tax=Humitalea sp. 24SJ18S-53 TaxID=3422307 RepID=UPI003D67A5E8
MKIGRRGGALAAAGALVLATTRVSAQGALPSASVVFNDGLSVPIPARPPLGTGLDRALVLGGGGEFFAAWMLGFMHGLNAGGVPYAAPDIIIGTSAGSFVGSTIAGGHITRLTREFDFFGRFPGLMSDLVPVPVPNASQRRAHELCASASDASPATIQAIGRGAMAARNPSVTGLQRMIEVLTGNVAWPDPKFHAATMDCYSGERLIVSARHGVPVSHAVSASMSLPGIFGPTFVGDRLCMDGGISSTSLHADVVAGAKRAVVVSLTDGTPGSGPRFSAIPSDPLREMRDLEAAGTRTLLIAANPGQVNLVSPAEIGPALRAGHERGLREADRVKAFWA